MASAKELPEALSSSPVKQPLEEAPEERRRPHPEAAAKAAFRQYDV